MGAARDLHTISRSAANLNALVQAFGGESGDKPDLFTEAEWTLLQKSAQASTAIDVLARKAMQGRIDPFTVTAFANRAKCHGLAAVPLVMRHALNLSLTAGKDDAVQARLCVALLKGFGILVPGKPVDEEERQKSNVASAIIGKASAEELRDIVLQRLEASRKGLSAGGDDAA